MSYGENLDEIRKWLVDDRVRKSAHQLSPRAQDYGMAAFRKALDRLDDECELRLELGAFPNCRVAIMRSLASASASA